MLQNPLYRIFIASIYLFVCFFQIGSALAVDKVWLESDAKAPVSDFHIPSFAPLIERLTETVVNISTEGKEENAKSFKLEDLFLDKEKKRSDRPFRSMGSGFVIHPDGYVVTNFHVVENASKIIVTFKDDEKKYEADIVGSDKRTDIALLKVKEVSNLKSVYFGDSDKSTPGDWVLAIGNPFFFSHTSTVGIISAKSRQLNLPDTAPYVDFIQTDASINQGNSGGPLFNVRGEVIGVNTAIYSPARLFGGGGGSIGIGFAIPINLVKQIVSELYSHGKVTRGWLGVLIQRVDEDIALAMDLPRAAGALVADVMPDSPAQKAGLSRGDVIVTYDGKVVEENKDLPLLVARTGVGKVVGVEIIRNAQRKVLDVTIGELVDESANARGVNGLEEANLGIRVQDLTDDMARALGLEELRGVVVSEVEPGSPAEQAELKRGDVILEVGSQLVKSKGDYYEAVRNLDLNRPVLVLVRRGRNTLFFTLKVEQERAE